MARTFADTLRAEVAALAKRLKITEDKAFVVRYAIEAFRLEEQEALEAASYDGGNDRGIDLFVVDDEWERVVIGQGKNLRRADRAPKPAELALLLDTIDELAEPQELLDAGRRDLAEAAEAVQEARARGYSVQLHFIYPGAKSEELDRAVRRFNRQNNRDNVGTAIIRLDDLELLHEDYVGASGRVREGSVDIHPNSQFEQHGEYGRSLVATVRGESLKALYAKHGNRLFDQNVRLFIGTRKGTVNAGIRDTLRDTEDRKHFWAYNNGITIVARNFAIDENERVYLTDFSVVNGCQTTVSLAEASEAAAEDAEVMTRIIAATDPTLVDKIIKFTNSQTPINVWDISARDPVQQKLKRELGDLEPSWFYALRRGELETLPDKAAYGRGEDRRVLPFPQSAQFLAAMKGLPVEAYKDKARLFTTHKDRVFSADVSAADVLWSWKVGRAIERAVKDYSDRFGADEQVAAILKRGSRFFATAVAAQMLRLRNGDDFVAKMGSERLGDNALGTRLKKYAVLGVAWYVSAMRALMDAGNELPVLLRNTDTGELLERRIAERMYEEEQAPTTLKEKLPLLPGIGKR